MKRVFALPLVVAVGALSSCVDTPEEPEEVGEAREALVTDCPYLNPALPEGAPLANPVDYQRELVITDLAVIDNPCRTTWTRGGLCAGTRGVWTFGMLMTRMAGTVPPAQFVADWLHSFEVPNVVNGFPVPARPGIVGTIIDPWLVASGCAAGTPVLACPTLDLKKAPFRLLGILNRSDLSGPGFGATEHGQTRFVFGATANGDPLAGPSLPFTVIFEYDNPSLGVGRTDLQWVGDYHVLTDPAAVGALGSPAYLAKLQSITDPITSPGAEPGKPNFGSTIATFRTNEIAFGGPVWKMREYQLKSTGGGINAFRLRLDPLDQTPDDSLNATAALDGFLFPNSTAGGSPALADFTFTLPVGGFQGGESSAPLPGPSPWWDRLGTPLTPLERHHFGFATCNGCHRVETATPFVHLAPRNPGAPTVLSPFLSTSTVAGAGGLPAFVQNVADPAPTGATFHYNEPWRRVCEQTRIFKGFPDPWSRGHGGH